MDHLSIITVDHFWVDIYTEKVCTSPSYVNRLIKSPEKIVNKTFVQMMEQLGYDIEIAYVKR